MMIKSLTIRNFRSILASKIKFSDSGLTVLIGANGSGKTNVVKSLEFLSALARDGLESAVSQQGGQLSIVPKAIARRGLRSVETSFDYTVELSRPPSYPTNHPAPTASHSLKIQWARESRFSVSEEVFRYSQPLAVAAALRNEEQREAGAPSEELPPISKRSQIQFIRTAQSTVVKTNPPLTKRNVDGFLAWLGFGFLENLGATVENTRDLNRLLYDISRHLPEEDWIVRPSMSLLDPDARPPFALSPQAGIFRSVLRNIKRFDLQLAELRKEQQTLRSASLSPVGGNLPGVVRWIRSRSDEKQNWERISRTLTDVAPHVRDLRVNTLTTGREYVEFIETVTGRPVESWDSSDGTLRVLAILLAVETHPPGGTVIIEEPEQGLHPWAVRTMMDHIRTVIPERGIQVVITTHSQQVLEEADPEEVFVTTRAAGKGTSMQSVAEMFPHQSLSRGELGRLWVKGLLGGVPSSGELK